MAPSYIISNKLPSLAKKIGFLNSITSKISVYKATPAEAPGTYNMFPLVVDSEGKIVEKKTNKPYVLTLSDADGLKNPLEGAKISTVTQDDPEEIYFPSDKDVETVTDMETGIPSNVKKDPGLQYHIAKTVYEKAKLESTWRKSFLTGPYLSQYANVDDVVLKLYKQEGGMLADFFADEKVEAKSSKEEREKIFTNKKSAFLKGYFTVTEPLDGMFVFKPAKASQESGDIVKGRIGLFIDVFDATKSLNQDVVELAMVDSEHPEDFLMYYEHPDNGEGEAARE